MGLDVKQKPQILVAVQYVQCQVCKDLGDGCGIVNRHEDSVMIHVIQYNLTFPDLGVYAVSRIRVFEERCIGHKLQEI